MIQTTQEIEAWLNARSCHPEARMLAQILQDYLHLCQVHGRVEREVAELRRQAAGGTGASPSSDADSS